MEVKAIGQGRQIAYNASSADGIKQLDNIGATENIKIDDNINSSSGDISEKKLQDAVEKLNKFLEDSGTHAEYEFHDKLKHDLMIKIVDSKSGEVIREVPPKKILDMVAKMLEMVGVLIDKKA